MKLAKQLIALSKQSKSTTGGTHESTYIQLRNFIFKGQKYLIVYLRLFLKTEFSKYGSTLQIELPKHGPKSKIPAGFNDHFVRTFFEITPTTILKRIWIPKNEYQENLNEQDIELLNELVKFMESQK